jgi:hypothetical protein
MKLCLNAKLINALICLFLKVLLRVGIRCVQDLHRIGFDFTPTYKNRFYTPPNSLIL